MRALLVTTALLLPATLPAQELRLDALVARPLAHVAMMPDAEAARPGARPGDRGATSVDLDLGLLDEPALAEIVRAFEHGGFEHGPGHAHGEPAREGDVPVLATLRQLARLSTGELEFAVVALLPRVAEPDLPLLVGRLRLSERGRDALQRSLQQPGFASEQRRVAAVPVYGLSGVSQQRPGSVFEIAAVGADLLVANHRDTLDDILRRAGGADGAGTTTGVHPESLARDELHVALTARLRTADAAQTDARSAGSEPRAVVSLDWERLGPRVLRDLAAGEQLALRATGMGAARRVVLGISREPKGLRTTILVDLPAAARGLFAAAQVQPLRRLVQDVPVPALASLTIAVDPRRIGAAETADPAAQGDPLGFHSGLVGSCRAVGLDFDSQVRPRLGEAVSCRVVMLPAGPDQEGPGRDGSGRGGFERPGRHDHAGHAVVALAIATRNERAARSLLDDLAAALRDRDFQVDEVPLSHDGARSESAIVVQLPGAWPAGIAAIDDTLVISADFSAIARIAELERSTTRAERTRHRSDTLALLDSLVAGRRADARAAVAVFDLDGTVLTGGEGGRHAGLVVLDEGALRVEVLSPR